MNTAVELPTVELPTVELPTVELPKAELPKAELPKAELPKAELPKAELPKVELSKVELPKAELPKAELPKVELSKVELPKVELPKVELPKVELPKIAIALEPQQIWKGFHWLFFINIQGLIICLRRFEANLAVGNVSAASVELETATDLMLASGASMEMAGSFSRQEYEHHIRPSMMPPQVKSTDFSGLMSWDHSSLMEIWKRLRPKFETLPATLSAQHDRFIAAYLSMANAHSAVCQKFGGGEAGSLRCDKGTAVRTLEKFTHNRWKLIDPNHRVTGGCPFSAASLNEES